MFLLKPPLYACNQTVISPHVLYILHNMHPICAHMTLALWIHLYTPSPLSQEFCKNATTGPAPTPCMRYKPPPRAATPHVQYTARRRLSVPSSFPVTMPRKNVRSSRRRGDRCSWQNTRRRAKNGPEKWATPGVWARRSAGNKRAAETGAAWGLRQRPRPLRGGHGDDGSSGWQRVVTGGGGW